LRRGEGEAEELTRLCPTGLGVLPCTETSSVQGKIRGRELCSTSLEQTSNPFIPGRPTSRITKSTPPALAPSKPLFPSDTTRT
jgi:hypothetical protein